MHPSEIRTVTPRPVSKPASASKVDTGGMGVIGGDFGFTVGVADPDKDDFMVHVFLVNIMF